MSDTGRSRQDELKRAAAEAAVALIEDGMTVGLGTGSTAGFAITALARRVGQGLRVRAIPTSERTATLAAEGRIALADLATATRIDLTIDGADEVELGSLDLVKGLGGALLREKIVAAASERLVIIVDGSKLVDRLGTKAPIPVEVVPFGWEATARRIEEIGSSAGLRRQGDGSPFITDGGHYILDAALGPLSDPAATAARLKTIVGVVETGLFIARTSRVIVAEPEGIRELTPDGRYPPSTPQW
jgi:ribose 5-phosphate isomerase A